MLDDFKSELKAYEHVDAITTVEVDVQPSDVGKSALAEKCLKYLRREGNNALAKKLEAQLKEKHTWSEYLKLLTRYVMINLDY